MKKQQQEKGRGKPKKKEWKTPQVLTVEPLFEGDCLACGKASRETLQCRRRPETS